MLVIQRSTCRFQLIKTIQTAETQLTNDLKRVATWCCSRYDKPFTMRNHQMVLVKQGFQAYHMFDKVVKLTVNQQCKV